MFTFNNRSFHMIKRPHPLIVAHLFGHLRPAPVTQDIPTHVTFSCPPRVPHPAWCSVHGRNFPRARRHRFQRWPRRVRPVASSCPRFPWDSVHRRHRSSSPHCQHESHAGIRHPLLTPPHSGLGSSSFSLVRAAMWCRVVHGFDAAARPGATAPSPPLLRISHSYSVTDESLKPPSAFPATHLPSFTVLKWHPHILRPSPLLRVHRVIWRGESVQGAILFLLIPCVWEYLQDASSGREESMSLSLHLEERCYSTTACFW
jgi:hypothetical protein